MTDPQFDGPQAMKAALGRTKDCLPPEILEALAEPSGDSAALAPARVHLDSCPHCQSELRLLREFMAAEVRPEDAAAVEFVASRLARPQRASVPRKASWWEAIFAWPRMPAYLAAATVLLLAGIGVYFRQRQTPGAPQPMVYRSQQFNADAPSGDIPDAPSRFSWREVPGAARYDLVVMEVDRTPVWSTQTAAVFADAPADIRRLMTPGRSFLWQVVARNPAGEKIAESNLQNFHVAIATPAAPLPKN